MKQILQNLRHGEIRLPEVPRPHAGPNQVVVKTSCSLVSAGTERMLVEFGRAGWAAKARQQPDKLRQVLEKVRTDGLVPAVDSVLRRLEEPLPLGYCNAGTVVEVGPGAVGFKPGDRVVSNGAHAEFVAVGTNLCARIPPEVSNEQAVFAVLAGVGLEGLRLAEPTLGERFVVCGLGLIGLLTVQLLQANGCEVLGLDPDLARLERAAQLGAVTVHTGNGGDPVTAAMHWTAGRGVDGVLITASARSDELIHQSAGMCRKRGRIVLVGMAGLNLQRADFYEKELSFQVSCSYGPGRYDEAYEKQGRDYPFGFVRWTEQRNFEAALALMQRGRLRTDDLVTHRFALRDAPLAYEAITSDRTALGVILEYPQDANGEVTVAVAARGRRSHLGAPWVRARVAPQGGRRRVRVGVIGAGNFAAVTLLPALGRAGAEMLGIADHKGAAAQDLAARSGAQRATTDYRNLLEDPAMEAVFIATGHHWHARLVCEALAAGKHVFVEKPLCLSAEELDQIGEAYHQAQDGAPAEASTNGSQSRRGRLLMVGFNRRFSVHTDKVRSLLAGRSEPLAMTMTVNAGMIPPAHWVHDPTRGGGRIIGEACHFIDLMVWVAGSAVRSVSAVEMGGSQPLTQDKMAISLAFEDGSLGSINYFANGSKAYPKERLEVFSEGRVVRLDNFRETTGFGFNRRVRFKTWRQDKGHEAEVTAFLDAVAGGGPAPISFDELANVTLASFGAVEAAQTREVIALEPDTAEMAEG